MPTRTFTDAERQARREADRRHTREAVEALRASDGWQKWLSLRRHFRTYSLTNQLLIALAMPEATRVAGFKAWLKLGYSVRRGEHAVIRIWMPIPPSRKQLADWEAAGGDPADEPRTRYRLGPVWDRSQVEPLPPPAKPVALDPPIPEPEGDSLAWAFPRLQALADDLGCSLVIERHPDGRGVTGLTFRNWLRAQKAAGHPLVARHEHRTRYRFTPGEAELLIAEYRSSKGTTPAGPTVPVACPRRRAASAASAPRSTLPALPRSLSRTALEGAGFVGWATWPNLRLSNYSPIPAPPGAYVVYRPTADSPVFVQLSPAGWFKAEDPTVPEARLRSEWVEGAQVVYIGKADVLRRRLTQFGQFGAGEPVGHRGGRLIWQLADAGDLLVAWHEITWDEVARDYERRLLVAFAEQHGGRRPFANLTG